MLKNGIIHPELIRQLALCGHGDKILIADANYPLAQESGNATKIYLGLRKGLPTVTQVLENILQAINAEMAEVMEPGDGSEPAVFGDFIALLGDCPLKKLSRDAFYRAGGDLKVRIAIATGEERVFANILLTVGTA